MRRRPFVHRHIGMLAWVAVIVALAIALAYQVWATNQDDHTQTRITRAASTCSQVDRIYTTLLQLMAHDESFSAGQVSTMVRQRRDRLTAQGCVG